MDVVILPPPIFLNSCMVERLNLIKKRLRDSIECQFLCTNFDNYFENGQLANYWLERKYSPPVLPERLSEKKPIFVREVAQKDAHH